MPHSVAHPLALAVALAVAGFSTACGGRTGLVTPDDGGPKDQPHLTADRPKPLDLTPPLPDGPQSPCNPNVASVEKTYSDRMVVCRGGKDLIYNQCQAHALCGPGWRLCKGSEYKIKFSGKLSPPGTETSWIAGCVLTDGKPHAPRDQICGECTFTVVKAPIIGFHCHKDAASFVQRKFAGLVSHPECWMVGIKAAANAAYWAPNTTDYKLRQAFCCR